MMYRMRGATPADYYQFYCISKTSEPGFMLEPGEFFEEMGRRNGFAVLYGDEVIGSVLFSNLRPGKTVVVHCIVKEQHHGRWARPSFLRTIATYAYDALGVEEIIGYGTEGVNDKALKFLEQAGFQPIRTMRVLSLHRDACRFR